MLEIMKFGTQGNWCVPDAVVKSDFSFEFSKLSEMANKVSGQKLNLESLEIGWKHLKLSSLSNILVVWNGLNV